MTAVGTATTGERFKRPAPDVMAGMLAQLAARFGNRFSASAPIREQHANTVTGNANQPPTR